MKRFRALKDTHVESRERLAEHVALYQVQISRSCLEFCPSRTHCPHPISHPFQELYEDGGENGPHKAELEALLDAIEKMHIQVGACAARPPRVVLVRPTLQRAFVLGRGRLG